MSSVKHRECSILNQSHCCAAVTYSVSFGQGITLWIAKEQRELYTLLFFCFTLVLLLSGQMGTGLWCWFFRCQQGWHFVKDTQSVSKQLLQTFNYSSLLFICCFFGSLMPWKNGQIMQSGLQNTNAN